MARKQRDQARRDREDERKALEAAERRAAAERAAAVPAPRTRKVSLVRDWDALQDPESTHRGPSTEPLSQATGGRATTARSARFRALLEVLERRLPKRATDVPSLHVLWMASAHEPVRPLDTWKPKGKAAGARFRSLLTHLLLTYKVPTFLFAELSSTAVQTRRARMQLLVHLGQGGSMKQARQRGYLPSCLTKRMCHFLGQSRATRTLPEAIREAQVRAFGGDRRLTKALQGSFLGQRLLDDEPFWQTVVQWFCRQPMLDPALVGPLLDYIAHREEEDPALSMGGRTPAALMRGMEGWHAELAQVAKLRGQIYEPSGLRGLRFEEIKKRRPQVWTVTEILDAKTLAAEGRAMRHCVYSYGRSIESGRCSIWSLRLDDQRRLTLEVLNQHARIVQVRGLCNRAAEPVEERIVRRWAGAAGLSL